MNGWLGPSEVAAGRRASPGLLSQSRSTRSALGRLMANNPRRALYVTSSAPLLLPERLLDHERLSVFWSHAGHSAVGFGVAAEIEAEGSERFARIQARAPELLTEPVDFRQESVQAPPPPRLFGGFAFAPCEPGQAKPAPWEAFGDARFVLPRLCYWATPGGTPKLSLFIRGSEHAQVSLWLERMDSLLAWMRRFGDEPAEALDTEPAVPAQLQQDDVEHWRALIDSILAGIGTQRWSKVVAARRREMAFDRAISLSRTMRVLAESHPGSTRFAFRFGQTAFVGATPERLLSKRGLMLRSEALAGTFDSDSAALAAELLERPKERDEHTPVLRAIISALAPDCHHIDHAERPQLRSLKHVLHLCTPIEAELSQPRHVLELAARLHPTPAVGGVPTAAAVRWILEHEPFERGWYCGPVGWFDAAGDGHFDVALRSGIIRGNHVHLFAGAGIVQGSKPLAEYEETELKLCALRSALRT